MTDFHVRIYCRPAESADTEAGDHFLISFESAFEALDKIDRLFIELDGSFVWRTDAFQIDGHLYDRSDRLYYVELSGNAPGHAVERILATSQANAATLIVELVRTGEQFPYTEWLDSLG